MSLYPIIIGFSLLTSCATITKNTIKAIKIEPQIQVTPLVVDLDIVPRKTIGEAIGSIHDPLGLKQKAVTEAMGQNPPSPDKPDVLIGATFFYETMGNTMRVKVTGYPAFYTNFRSASKADSIILGLYPPLAVLPQEESLEHEPVFESSRQLYFSGKFQVSRPISHFGGNIQLGSFYKDMFFAFDFGLGGSRVNFVNPNVFIGDDHIGTGDFGGGFSLGRKIQPTNWLKIVPGASGGFWTLCDYGPALAEHMENYKSEPGPNNEDEDKFKLRYEPRYAFGGPFVKLLLGKNLVWGEISYRVLLGQEHAHQFMAGITIIQ